MPISTVKIPDKLNSTVSVLVPDKTELQEIHNHFKIVEMFFAIFCVYGTACSNLEKGGRNIPLHFSLN